MNNDGFDSVADSTDWLATPLSGLSAVEAALRCQICKDFYRTPMLTSCNHTFCSLCIRRALSADGKCPLCRAGEQEMKLRSNWSMEEVVAAFTQTRSAVLEFARKPPPAPPTWTEASKRKTDDMIMDDGDEQPSSSSQQQRSSKRLRSSARISKTRSIETTAEMARQEAHVPDPEPTPVEPDDGLVACPICWRRMKAVQVDRHIDTSCPGEPQPDPTPPIRRNPSKSTSLTSVFAPSSSSSTFPSNNKPQPPPDRLPAINYSMLKEAQLKKELIEQGLSTTGNRGMLERRHREWVMIWNANCDSQRPRRRAELLHDLDVWERTLGSRAPTGSRAANTGAQIKDKDFDGAAWASKHDTSFKDLIANARRTRAQAQVTKPDEGGCGKENGVKNETINISDEDSKTVKPTVSDTLVLLDTERIVGVSVGDPPTIKPLEEGKESEPVPT
ncbi:DNA repair protein rad18 [Xylaria curta]|nr:DNA repair protein rad18 [Xylaria curta]